MLTRPGFRRRVTRWYRRWNDSFDGCRESDASSWILTLETISASGRRLTPCVVLVAVRSKDSGSLLFPNGSVFQLTLADSTPIYS
ncbi:Bifunctional protein FolD [Fusarium oxysporum f. sp. albedinis]|nr:Bifunctional protein FolD [Fusarium oxysporum f. sp. albedinis]